LPLPSWWIALQILILPVVWPALYLATVDINAAYNISINPLASALGAWVLCILSAILLLSVLYEKRAFRAGLWNTDLLIVPLGGRGPP
jgi:hypothetical protein